MKSPAIPSLFSRSEATTKRFGIPDRPRDLMTFSAAYRRTAQKLSGENDRGSLDDLPVLFLYRHAVEIALKAVLILAGVNEKKVLKESHNLRKLMPDLRKQAKRHACEVSRDLENLIDRWTTEDPDDVKVRYPKAKDGTPSLIVNDRRFGLQSFVTDAEKALDELHELFVTIEDLEYSPCTSSTR